MLFCDAKQVIVNFRENGQAIVALAPAFRILHNGIPVFDTDGIAKAADSPRAAPEIPKLSSVVKAGGVPNNVIMDMGFINMGADDKSVVPFGEAAGQFIAQAVGLFRGDFAGDEGLPYLIGDHIILSPPSASLGGV